MKSKLILPRRHRGVEITARDVEIIRLVWQFGVVTRPILQRALGWPCVSDVNRRIHKLLDAQLLDKRATSPLPGGMAIYYLGAAGVGLLAERDNIDLKSLNQRRFRYRNVSDGFLRHELLTAAFGASLRGAFLNNHAAGILDWRHADDLIGLCNLNNIVGDVLLKPDAFCSYHIDKVRFNFFLEADCGTESLRRIDRKIELYRNFKNSGLYELNFKLASFRLLFVTSTVGRALSLARHMSEVPEFKVFVASQPNLQSGILATPVWYRSEHETPVALHETSTAAKGESSDALLR